MEPDRKVSVKEHLQIEQASAQVVHLASQEKRLKVMVFHAAIQEAFDGQ